MKEHRERDYRLDFCRGIALIVIFIDHVPDNPLSAWTLRNFSFCDAAEVFVLISGMASYLAYGSRYSKLGFTECARAAGRNLARIYIAHLFLIGLISGVMLWAAHRFWGTDYIDALKLQWIAEDPRGAIFAATTLRYLPRLMDILPLYILLLTIAPALIALIKRDYRVALLISVAIYGLAWILGLNLSADRSGREWYFNPFAWQLLYVIGMTLSHLSRNEPLKLPWGRGYLYAAFAFLFVTTVIAWPLNQMHFTESFPLYWIWPADKTYLSPLRIINVLALLYVFAYYVSPQAPWLRRGLAEMCIACGRRSLTIYGLGLLLSNLGFVIVQQSTARNVAYIAVNALGISLLFLTASVLDRRDEARRSAVPASALRIRRQGSAAA
jgi:hypothetical protein